MKNVIENGDLQLNKGEWLHLKRGYNCKGQTINRSGHDRMTKVNSRVDVNKR